MPYTKNLKVWKKAEKDNEKDWHNQNWEQKFEKKFSFTIKINLIATTTSNETTGNQNRNYISKLDSTQVIY